MAELTEQPAFPLARARGCPFDPAPEYARFRDEQPLVRAQLADGSLTWLITRHEDVRRILVDPRSSSDRTLPGFPRLVPGQEKMLANFKPSLISLDPPQHTAVRRSVLPEFTVKRVQKLRPRIEEIINERVDALLAADKPADLVALFALPVPSLVICELLGISYADHEFFQQRTAHLINRTSTPEQRMTAFQELLAYFEQLVTEKEKTTPDDILGRQIRKQRAEEVQVLDHDELVNLAFLLLVAGHETTANMIALGTLAFLRNPEQLAIVTQDKTKLPGAVDEMLRYFSVVQSATSRVATEDIEIAGTRIKAGEGMIAVGPSANRDPSVFADPDILDVTRTGNSHVAFGYGPHQCIGVNLAKLELEIAYETLFRRIPTLALAENFDELQFKSDANIYGLYQLNVTW